MYTFNSFNYVDYFNNLLIFFPYICLCLYKFSQIKQKIFFLVHFWRYIIVIAAKAIFLMWDKEVIIKIICFKIYPYECMHDALMLDKIYD